MERRRNAGSLRGRCYQLSQGFIDITEDQHRVLDRPDLVNSEIGAWYQKYPAPFISASYRILNSLEFLIRAASRYISNHTPVSNLVGTESLLPHSPFNE